MVHGNDYANNDLVAFSEDLLLLQRLGWRVVPLDWVIQTLLKCAHYDLSRCVVLTCDDGVDFDYWDLDHPQHGPQKSFYNRLQDVQRHNVGMGFGQLELSAFVIASPMARQTICQKGLGGLNWMSEDWWASAQKSGLMRIQNHSWDHNHEMLEDYAVDQMKRGDFFQTNNSIRAEYQILKAKHYLDEFIQPHRTNAFAYPYGHVPTYLSDEWFPAHGVQAGIEMALGCGGEPVTAASSRWNMPRYVCGDHWKSPGDLERILRDLI
jgi:peptidoglycan/xylan/chitin deacetylase (PgdA/CDA1 family)